MTTDSKRPPSTALEGLKALVCEKFGDPAILGRSDILVITDDYFACRCIEIAVSPTRSGGRHYLLNPRETTMGEFQRWVMDLKPLGHLRAIEIVAGADIAAGENATTHMVSFLQDQSAKRGFHFMVFASIFKHAEVYEAFGAGPMRLAPGMGRLEQTEGTA